MSDEAIFWVVTLVVLAVSGIVMYRYLQGDEETFRALYNLPPTHKPMNQSGARLLVFITCICGAALLAMCVASIGQRIYLEAQAHSPCECECSETP